MAKPLTGLGVFGSSTLDSTATLDTNYAAIAAAINDLNTYSNQVTDTGAANAIVVTSGPNLTATLAFGLTLYVKMAATNTSTVVSLNLNGLGARSVLIATGAGPPVGSLVAAGVYQFIYDGTNFQAVGIFGAAVFSSNNTWTGTNAFNNNVTVSVPSGVALTLNGNSYILNLVTSTARGGGFDTIEFNDPTGLKAQLGFAANVDDLYLSNELNGQIILRTNGNTRQAISPTGNITINAPTSGTALSVQGAAAAFAQSITGGAATGGALQFVDGNTGAHAWGIGSGLDSTADFSVRDVTGSSRVAFKLVTATTAIQGYGPVAAALVDMTPDKGSFTITLTGCTAAITGTALWRRIGSIVLIYIPALQGTSNSTSATLTGIPAAIQPASAAPIFAVSGVSGEDNNATALVSVQILSGSGTWNLYKNTSLTGFTAAGQKGLAAGITLAYTLD
jgi:hypothetical protein